MSIVLNGDSGITTPMYGGAIASNQVTPVTGFKNRIINGAMMIDQRNAGASVTANDGVFAVDRFRFSMTQSSKGTGQQSSVAPAGFVNSLLFTSTASTSLGASDQFTIVQPIEGFNIADLGWGTANAQTVTLSFWVRSSLTGTFGGALQNQSANRSYPFTYTISSANTFEYKTVTVVGDTTGTWNTNNNLGIRLHIGLGMGSNFSGTAGSWAGSNLQSATGATSVVGTNGATFYITGVQLEKGSTATSFDYRPYGTELQLCQRYCQAYRADSSTNYAYFSIGQVTSSTQTRQAFIYKTPFRSQPTVTTSAANTFILDPAGGGITLTDLSLDRTTTDGGTLVTTVASSSMSAQQCVRMLQNSTNTSYVIFSAEL